MKSWQKAALAVAFLTLYVSPALAAWIEIGQALNGGLQEFVNAVVTAAVVLLVSWVLMVLKRRYNIDIDAGHRDALIAFVGRQAAALVAMGAVELNGAKIEVPNATVANLANKGLDAIPDAMKHFGLTPDALQERIVSMLPKEPAVAQAQAVALDAANPATPSKAA